jgi:signal transduction histidine kinase
MSFRFKLLIFLLSLLSFTWAHADVIIGGNNGITLIGKQIYVLQSKRELAFRDVVNSPDFRKYDKDVPNLGYSALSTWMRFTIANHTRDTSLLLDVAYPLLNEVELFTPTNNQYHSILMGEIKKFDDRKYQHPDYIFDLSIPPNTSKTYYLRIKTSKQLIVPIGVSASTEMWQFLNKGNLLSGIFMGAVVIMLLYNLFIFFVVRDKSYIYYVIYVASVGLTQLGIKGYTFQYLWGNSPAFESISTIFFACIAAIAALLFTKSFLLTREKAKKSNIVLTSLIILFSIAILLTLAGKVEIGFQLMQVLTTLLVFSVLIISGIVIKGGYAPAGFVFLSWSVLFVGAIIFALKDTGILPFNTFTSYSMQGASAIEMALLSFGLADSINILKREKEQSQALALAAARENERIIREQNVILEQKVEERTHELNESNHELNMTLDNLKQTQSQLVESEKMASLGQLTAGIAHEINNPINFVTSNVSPLKRDVEMMFNALNIIEEVGMSDLSAADKQKKIKEFKEELDFDYLTMEINHLIKGINEGANRTAEIVKGLRVFSRLDEDDLKKADINEGLESTIIIANNLLNNKIKVTRHYGDLPLAECYPGKLNQVFLNMISNAAYAIQKRFGDETGGELSLTTTHDDKYIFIKIKDNGAGIDHEKRTKIFEPFFTTKGVGEGTGLGLSISYNTIKKHNGQITFNSVPGEGTEFIIQIPIIFNIKAT